MSLTTSIDELFASVSQQFTAAGDESTPQVLYTGRYIAVFKDDATAAAIDQFKNTYNLSVASADSFEDSAVSFTDLGDAEVLVFPQIGTALVSPQAYAALNPVASQDPSVASSPESTPQVFTPDPNSPVAFFEPEIFLFPTEDDATAAGTEAPAAATNTYGLDLTGVSQCGWMGNGIKVCILDTGLDLTHPDFAGRTIVSSSFVGQSVQDGHGHGTHTAGTACGPYAPGGGIPRYGIAYGSSIYIGKVLTDSGKAVSGSVLAGIAWAVANKCEVVSMSLSAPSGPQAGFTAAGKNALAAGTLLIAASGNDSTRPTTIANTGAPANSPTIMAVAGLDKNLDMYVRSNGGKIEIAGPGVDVFSSVPTPLLHGNKTGTSMATPHVAGIAALWAESQSDCRGQSLWNALTSSAKPVTLGPTDVGAGMVQAPTSPAVSKL